MTSSRSSLRAEVAAQPSPAPAAVPALMARYRDLASLRYDYPLVLTQVSGAEPPVQTLTGIVDGVLRQLAPPGPDGERLRRHVLKLEQHIRAAVAGGATGTLSELWQRAAQAVLANGAAATKSALADDFERVRRAILADGTVMDCTSETPARFVTHLWRASEAARAAQLSGKIRRLILRLRDLLRTDFLESPEALAPGQLGRAFGPPYAELLDFQALSRTLGGTVRRFPLPERRRRRIRAALETLETQRFVPGSDAAIAHAFESASCVAAIEAFRSRLPEMAAVVRAMQVAELELENRYREAEHDPFFERFDATRLTPADRADFPNYLVTVRDTAEPAEQGAILEALSAGLPLKILVQFDDILPDPAGAAPAGRRIPAQLARMAVGLNDVFVLQASGSHLYRMRHGIQRGMDIAGPALFCMYSGGGAATDDLPPYLVAAAAVESRAFPLFSYDPAAETDWATRFALGANPQAESAWPIHAFEYESDGHQRVTERCTFTFADFAACDRRYAAQLEPVSGVAEKTALVLRVDADGVLRRFAANDGLVDATRRCADAWRGLQALGGVNEPRVAKEPTPLPAVPAPPAAVTPAPATAAMEPPAPAASDEAYIETPRCTTCDECTHINNRLFAYNENKQAYIADLAAGTYRELVEAAESCQVSIIHPGKPRNPNEPGLDELVQRAAAFR